MQTYSIENLTYSMLNKRLKQIKLFAASLFLHLYYWDVFMDALHYITYNSVALNDITKLYQVQESYEVLGMNNIITVHSWMC